ncbi:hypothetical protein AZE42_10040 [Rhizopogon vesiculosus]|uniref:RNase H type-1 domain-containing protein n=1 Tax=Rhizopogon vesiculosus TaxID=180088 RepID=A0A1J8QFM4_9AGAM|nr:hypothetical protein AZE42_10040 [Rhizopogon vesiculosus]
MHPLYAPVRRAAKCYVSSHRSSLHCLTQAFAILPDDIESLIPSRRAPASTCPYKTHIAKSREEAIIEHENLTDTIQIFTDSSGHDRKIGAAATLFRAGATPRTLCFQLSTEKEHTVFEAEEVGLTLAARLLVTERNLTFPISISADNQAAILSSGSFHARPGSYLADRFRRMMQKTAKEHPDFNITLHWSPGHEGVHGNEEADKQAKLVAIGKHHNSQYSALPRYLQHGSLPLSISALKQAHHKETHTRWTRIWAESPRYACLYQLDPLILKRSFVKLTAKFSKCLTGLLLSLHSCHIPLNIHLHRLGKTNSPRCPHCPMTNESIHHYLFDCPHYQRERHILACTLGRQATFLPYLLADAEATPHLTRYVNATRRLKSMLGEILMPALEPD